METSGRAIVSLVFGIVWLFGVGSILAIVFGYLARREIRGSGGRVGGSGLAMAGIILGWMGLILTVVGVMAYGYLSLQFYCDWAC